eukprot:g46001.t1
MSLPSTSSSSSSTSTGTNPNTSIIAGRSLYNFRTAAAAYNLPTWVAAFSFSDPSVDSNDAKSIAGDTDKDKLARRIIRQCDCTTALAILMEALAEGILVDPSKATTGGSDSSGSAEEITRLRQELADQKLQLDTAKRRADEGPAFDKDGRTGPSAADSGCQSSQSAGSRSFQRQGGHSRKRIDERTVSEQHAKRLKKSREYQACKRSAAVVEAEFPSDEELQAMLLSAQGRQRFPKTSALLETNKAQAAAASAIGDIVAELRLVLHTSKQLSAS